jgi:LysM repeat protein
MISFFVNYFVQNDSKQQQRQHIHCLVLYIQNMAPMKYISKTLLTALLLIHYVGFAQQEHKVISGKKCNLYKVVSKDTWTGLARTYKISIEELKAVNPGVNDLKIGQIINIPKETGNAKQEESKTATQAMVPSASVKTNAGNYHTYVVEKGETLFGIARKKNVTADEIKLWNNLVGDGIRAGQVLKISGNPTTANMPVNDPAPLPPMAMHTKIATDVTTVADDKKLTEKNDAVRNDSKLLADAGKNIPATPMPAEIEYKSSRSEIKKPAGKGNSATLEINESGMASWINDGEMNQSKFYALHRSAPSGTIVKVTNRMSGDYVFVKVVGQLPDTGDNDRQIIKISEAAAKRIGAVNEKFQVELNYGLTQ